MTVLAHIPKSAAFAALAVVGSAAVHLGLVAVTDAPEPVEIAGGGGGEVAVQGTAFADLTEGVSTPVTQATATAVTAATPAEPAEPTQPVMEPATPITTPTAPADAAQIPAETATIPVSPTVPTVPVTDVVKASLPDTVTALSDSAPQQSLRPTVRPARPQRTAEKPPVAAPAASPAKPRGNAQVSASRGTASGATTDATTPSGAGQSRAAGNAAVSNYPGQVQSRIARQRLPRVRGRGTAQVSFTVAANGSLAALGLAGSSGSAELDREAVSLIRRAAPFPAPPAGAQTSFTIPVRTE